jgi:hypothetical protein
MTGVRRPRRWRGLDLRTTRVCVQAEAPRVAHAEHGVVAEQAGTEAEAARS